jgi:DMSO/TMAO reductase YedYZ heme-binding membrane subunit
MRLKKNWKRLHQMIYLIAPLVVLHYAWSKKGDFFALQGEIIRPLIYGVIVVILLAFRIPQVRVRFASLRDRILLQLKPAQDPAGNVKNVGTGRGLTLYVN